VYVVGAANSAGQAALHLAQYARRVVLLVRGDSLDAGMSQYLVERVLGSDKIELRLCTEVVAGGGSDHLEWLDIADRARGTSERVDTNWLFVFIGAAPRTDWLGDSIARDERGFVLTGPDVAALNGDGTGPGAGAGAGPRWPLERVPLLLETSSPGVFAAGDVRRSSMKRVASAVGEGSSAVSNVHLYLETV
jgi:thioredoxin reductase (NADPH)